jgi:hypothetical protein
MMYHNLTRSIILGNVSQSYGIVTRHLGTSFWEKKIGMSNISLKKLAGELRRPLD